MFPPGDLWNRDVSGAQVDPASDAYLQAMSPEAKVGLAFGLTETYWGARFVVVPPEQPLVPITYGVDGESYASQSDPGPLPIPLDVPIQGGSDANPDPSSGDRHVIVIQSGTCQLFELYQAVREPGGFRVSSSARFDLRTDGPRPAGFTSADGAGLPIFPGLVRWEEVASGEIHHALRFTLPRAQNAYVAPANHCGPEADRSLAPMGLRVRLRASFDESPYSSSTRVLLRAWKRYGLILADVGDPWAVDGVSDPGFADALRELRAIPVRGSAFEVVETGTIERCGGF